MDFNLQQATVSFFVGVYLLFGSWYVLEATLGFRLLGRYVQEASTFTKVATAVGCIACGIAAEVVSDRFSGVGYLPLVPREAEIKVEALFEPRDGGGGLKANALARSLRDVGLFALTSPEAADRFGREFDVSPIGVSSSDLEPLCKPLYYEAKNWCLQSPHGTELHEIQVRINFARASSIISQLLLALLLLLAFVKPIAGRESPPKEVVILLATFVVCGLALVCEVCDSGWIAGAGAVFLSIVAMRMRTRVIVISALVSTFWLMSSGTFYFQELEFNRKVYGYFQSAFVRGQVDLQPADNRIEPSSVSYSGLARVPKTLGFYGDAVVAVTDAKASDGGGHLVAVTLDEERGVEARPIAVDWGSTPPNDLEAICFVPGANEHRLLAVESTYWLRGESLDGARFGRVFVMSISRHAGRLHAELRAVLQIPRSVPGLGPMVRAPIDKGAKYHEFRLNIEGVACVRRPGTSEYCLLLASRGGRPSEPGEIVVIQVSEHQLEHGGDLEAVGAIRVRNKDWPIELYSRHVCELEVLAQGGDGRFWMLATATRDPDNDFGPFSSSIWAFGPLDLGMLEKPLPAEFVGSTLLTVGGLKLEGLALLQPANGTLECVFGSDDEALGGVIRRISLPRPGK